jgi:hypothetical protein
VSNYCYNLSRFVIHYCFRSFDERAASIRHVVNEDSDFIFDIAD